MDQKKYECRDFRSMLPDSGRITADHACNLILENPGFLVDVFKLATIDEPVMSMRAARVMQLVCENAPELLDPFIPEIVERIDLLEEEGAVRSFLKILIGKTELLSEDETSRFAGICFRWLGSSDRAIAVRVYCMYNLYEISNSFPEIKPELDAVIRFVMEEGSAGIKAAGKQVTAKLRNEISF